MIRLLWLDASSELAVGDVLHPFFGHFMFVDELDCVGAFDSSADSIGQPSKFVGG